MNLGKKQVVLNLHAGCKLFAKKTKVVGEKLKC